MVRDDLNALFQDVLNDNNTLVKDIITPRIEDFAKANPKFFQDIKTASYIFCPINIGGHLILVVLHLRPRIDTKGQKIYCDIDHVVLADPLNPLANQQVPPAMWRRLQLIFSRDRGFRFNAKVPEELWFPVQFSWPDNYSCGFRVYEMVRVILTRAKKALIEVIYEPEIKPDPTNKPIVDQADDSYCPDYYDGFPGFTQHIFADISGDFQPDKVRADMLGICVSEALRAQRYETRVFFGPVAGVRNYNPSNDDGPYYPVGHRHYVLSDLPRLKEHVQIAPETQSDWNWTLRQRQRQRSRRPKRGPFWRGHIKDRLEGEVRGGMKHNSQS